MVAPYYIGDSVPLKFTITDENGPVNPTNADVKIVKPDDTVVTGYSGSISGNEVTFTVPSSVTDTPGRYTVFFELTLPGSLIRTHPIEFDILWRPT